MSHKDPRTLWWCVGAVAALVGFYAWLFVNGEHRIGGDTGDFRHFYWAARAMLDGQDIYASGVPGMRAGYIYPPLLAFLYTPYAHLEPDRAAMALLVTNLAVSLVTLVCASRAMVERLDAGKGLGILSATVLVTTVLISDKIKGETQMWQTNVLVLLMFTLGLLFLDRKAWLAGLALGLAVNIKYLPIVLLPYLLLRRRWAAAGWFIFGTVAWALVPAVMTGWARNLVYLRQAFAGVLRLVGIGAASEGGPTADVEPITSQFSVSVTSAIARALGGDEAAGIAVVIGAVLGMVCVGIAAWMYWKQNVPLVKWPGAEGQRAQPYKAVVALEWLGVIVVVLALGPQTNPRHLYLLMLVMSAAAVMMLYPRPGVVRWPVVAGTAVLCAGLYLPPGGQRFDHWVREWRLVGGPSICLLVMYAGLLWSGLGYARACAEKPGAIEVGHSSASPGAKIR